MSLATLCVVAIAPRRLAKVAAAAMCFGVTLFSGAIVVNDVFSYYQTWGAAWADLTGQGDTYAVRAAHAELQKHGGQQGRLLQVQLTGSTSGISRGGLVYLPPQYDQSRYRNVRFPMVELLHGTPGNPGGWVTGLRVITIISRLIEHRMIGPVVLVMPDSNGGLRNAQECLNTPKVRDDTYISADVPADVRARFRVSAVPAQLGMIGFSSGGYCAANLMLRHRSSFGSAAILSGYFKPGDGEAAAELGNNAAAEAVNDPLRAALLLHPGTAPLPACWVATGTGNSGDYRAAKQFVHAVRRLETVPLILVRAGRHSPGTARTALPAALVWSWQQLADPQLRVQFPTVGSSTSVLAQANGLVSQSKTAHPTAVPTRPASTPSRPASGVKRH